MTSTSLKLPENERLYKDAYENQEKYFAKQKFWNNILIIISTFVPLLSLLFTLPVIYKHLTASNEPKEVDITSTSKTFILMSIVAAILPIFSGFFSKSISNSKEQFNRDTAPVQKISCSNEDFAKHKANRELYKNHHFINTTESKSSLHRKPSKFIVDTEQGKNIYMDPAQLRRWNQIENYAKNPWKPEKMMIGFFDTGRMQDKPTYNPAIADMYYKEIDASQRILLDLPLASM